MSSPRLLIAVALITVAVGCGRNRPAEPEPAPPEVPGKPLAPEPPPGPAPKPEPPARPKADDEPPPMRFRLDTAGRVRVPADAVATADLTAPPATVLGPGDGKPLALQWENGRTTALRVLPGDLLAVCGESGTVLFWDLAGDKPAGEVTLDRIRRVAELTATPDGESLVVGCRDQGRDPVLAGVDVRGRKMAWRAGARVTGRELILTTSADGRVTFIGSAATPDAGGPGVQLVDPRTGRFGPQRRQGYASAVGSADERVALFVSRPVVGSDFTLTLWDSVRDVTLGEYLVVPGKGVREERAVAFSPDGRALVFAADSTLYAFEAVTGKLVHKVKLPAAPCRNLSFSADGRLLAWHDDAEKSGGPAAHVFDLATGAELARVAVPDPGRVHSVALAPDGAYLLVGSGTGVVRYALPKAPPAPDGAAFPGTPPAPRRPVKPRPPVRPPVVRAFRPPPEPVTIPAIAPPTHVLARTPPRALNPDDGFLVNPIDRLPDTRAAATLPDGTVVTVSDSYVRFWDPLAGRWEGQVHAPDSYFRHVVASPDGTRVFAIGIAPMTGNMPQVVGFDVPRRAEAWRYREKLILGSWLDLGVSPDGRRVWAGGGFSATQARTAVLDAQTGEELHALRGVTGTPSPDPARGFAIARDAKTEEYTFSLRDPADAAGMPYLRVVTDTKKRVPGQNQLRSIALSRSGRRLAFAIHQNLIVVDTETAAVLHRVELNHPMWDPPAFSPDDRFLAWRDGDVSDHGGKAAYLFDLSAGREVARFERHEKTLVRGVTFTADGRSVVVVMGDVLLRFPLPPAGG